MNLVEKSHKLVLESLGENTAKFVVDATLGRGRDALFIAEHLLSDGGTVFGFDVQADAIKDSNSLIQKFINANPQREIHSDFRLSSHSQMFENIGEICAQKVDAIFFNLGYLPNSDRNIVTRPATTRMALQDSLKLAKKGECVLSLLCYRGHEGGEEEYQTALDFLESNKISFEKFGDESTKNSPILLFAKI